eukprot:Phypoly_transcript_21490.p1 GENE.Phypoly_transcript_21490~~Phypoly_transcript_21490.p1  ORF type:complete len:118 (+),score=16.82 Phypoly_transcript_21490:255-608(+)
MTSGTSEALSSDDTSAILVSQNCLVTLGLQPNGNLVLTQLPGTILWQSGVDSQSTNFRQIMQSDGNFVTYNAESGADWSSGSWGATGVYHLMLQDDGNLVIYDDSWHPTWSTGTWLL